MRSQSDGYLQLGRTQRPLQEAGCRSPPVEKGRRSDPHRVTIVMSAEGAPDHVAAYDCHWVCEGSTIARFRSLLPFDLGRCKFHVPEMEDP